MTGVEETIREIRRDRQLHGRMHPRLLTTRSRTREQISRGANVAPGVNTVDVRKITRI